jgi:hypothetical protein
MATPAIMSPYDSLPFCSLVVVLNGATDDGGGCGCCCISTGLLTSCTCDDTADRDRDGSAIVARRRLSQLDRFLFLPDVSVPVCV